MAHKVAHLSTVHTTFDSRIFLKECRSLAKAGYETVFITPHERDEMVEGVQIRALPSPRNRLDRMFRLSLNMLFLAFRERADLYHFHDPELLPAGIILSLSGKHVIYDAHEDVPKQILDKKWLNPWLRHSMSWVVSLLQKIASKTLSGIIVATPDIAKNFPPGKTTLVRNYPLLDELHYVERERSKPPWTRLVYIGGITEIRGIMEMLAALALLPDAYPVRLRLAGPIHPPALEARMRSHPGWKSCEYLGWLNRRAIADLLADSDIGLVPLHPARNHVRSLPIKMFEYMATGLPVVASDFPLWREIIETAGCGKLVNPLDPQAIADAIVWMVEHPREVAKMGASGRLAIERNYNWQPEFESMQQLYRQILA